MSGPSLRHRPVALVATVAALGLVLVATAIGVRARSAPADCAATKCVALTFDDGPGPHTRALVDQLDSLGAPATLFLIGRQVQAHAADVRYAAERGMVLGNHSWDHPHFTKIPVPAQHDQLARTSRAIADASGSAPVLVRPPYGDWNATTKTLGVPLVLWDVDTRDWASHDGGATLSAIQAGTKPGSIILMHESEESSIAELPRIVGWLREQGYTLVTVPQLIGTPEPGRVYHRQGS